MFEGGVVHEASAMRAALFLRTTEVRTVRVLDFFISTGRKFCI